MTDKSQCKVNASARVPQHFVGKYSWQYTALKYSHCTTGEKRERKKKDGAFVLRPCTCSHPLEIENLYRGA